MADDGTLQQLAGALTAALQPLQTRLAAGDARGLLAEMGLALPAELDGPNAFSTAADDAITAVEGLAAPLAALAIAVEADDVGGIISATACCRRCRPPSAHWTSWPTPWARWPGA